MYTIYFLKLVALISMGNNSTRIFNASIDDVPTNKFHDGIIYHIENKNTDKIFEFLDAMKERGYVVNEYYYDEDIFYNLAISNYTKEEKLHILKKILILYRVNFNSCEPTFGNSFHGLINVNTDMEWYSIMSMYGCEINSINSVNYDNRIPLTVLDYVRYVNNKNINNKELYDCLRKNGAMTRDELLSRVNQNAKKEKKKILKRLNIVGYMFEKNICQCTMVR